MSRRGFVLLLILFGAIAHAQIVPDRTYNGVGRPFWVTVKRPKGAKGHLRIMIVAGGTASVMDTEKVDVGRADLAKLFPGLWVQKAPAVTYAQLVDTNKPVGPAMVMQPLLNPALSRLKPDGKTVEFVPDTGHTYSGIRAWVDEEVVLETSLGDMVFRMRPDAAPNTVWNFLELVKGGFYTDIIWHRIVAKRADGTPFVIQAGDPTGGGDGGPGYAFPLEDSSLPHDFGVISMARDTDPNTNGSQFFVCLSRAGTEHLDHKYASFGQLTVGKDVVLATASVPVGKDDHPLDPPVIKRAYLVDAPPYHSQ